MAEVPTAPVFRQLKRGVSVLGLSPKDWGKLAITIALGLLLFFAAGLPTSQVVVDRPAYEIQSEVADDIALRDAAAAAEGAMAKYGAEDPDQVDMKAETREKAQQAWDLGIVGSMSDDEVASLVASQQIEPQPVFSAVARGIVCILLPVVFFLFGHIQSQGTNFVTEVSRYIRCARSQHVYESDVTGLFEEARHV